MEKWDLYDEFGRRTGQTWERRYAKEIPEGRYHIVCDVLIRHRDGDLLLMRRDPNKDIYPGCLEAGAGGSALAGETPEEAAKREMLEETGLTADDLVPLGTELRPESHSVRASGAPKPAQSRHVTLQPGETAGWRWADPDTFLSLIPEEPLLKIQYRRYKAYLDIREE